MKKFPTTLAPLTLALGFIRIPRPFINFLVFFLRKTIFITRFKILEKQPLEVFLKNSQNWKESIHVFNTVYFSSRVNISFNIQFTRSYFWIWKICFHIALALFSFSIKITILFVHRQFLIHLRHWDQNKQKNPVYSNHHTYYISLNLPTSFTCLLRLPPFIRDLKVFFKQFAYLS